ncbi:hypothetical protein [Flavobacterium sp.]|uniref:hypothetical protein n=1 Tax=Flavobacterium sp. TaxID=239 RepID=UPI0026156AB3|nr:hypothetical protein [Flavobacterium sp.]
MKRSLFKSVLFLALPVISNTYAQKTLIQVLDKGDHAPLPHVLFYANAKAIATSDAHGSVTLPNTISDSVTVVKEDYYDTIINLRQLNADQIFLRKIGTTQLTEVVVLKRNIQDILDQVYAHATSLKNINFPKYIHTFNVLSTRSDTLLFMNNRLCFVKGKGCFIEQEHQIISHFTLENNIPVFDLDHFKISFNNNFTHANSPINSLELLYVARYRDEFVYTISEDDGLYKVSFTPQRSNKSYPYSGYIMIDKEDLGVYEFSAQISSGQNYKRNLALHDEILNFQILNESSYIRYEKNENGNYDLVKYAYDCGLKALNGHFKNAVFVNKCRKEPTPDFDASSCVLFNVMTYAKK